MRPEGAGLVLLVIVLAMISKLTRVDTDKAKAPAKPPAKAPGK